MFQFMSLIILAFTFVSAPQAEIEFPLVGPSGERIYGLGKILALDVAPSGERFATASPLGVFIWDVESGNIEHWLQTERKETTHLRFTPDGTELIVTTFDGYVQTWDGLTGERLREWQAHDGPITAIDISRDGTLLVTG